MSPERSGHCNQGGKPGRIHCTARYEKEGRLLICKSETCLYVVRLKLPSKEFYILFVVNEMSAFCRERHLFIYLQNTNLWNDRNRSVVFRDLDYLNLCTIKRQDEQNPVSVDLLYHLPPQPSDIDSSWILCRSRMVSSG